jgi:hypothetical protein
VAARKGEAGVTLSENELVYESGDTVSVFADDQLESVAARYGRQSTVDEDRWPTLGFHLAKNPELIESWQAFLFGGRIQALNVYQEVGLTTLDQIHRGHRERWNSRTWEVTLNCSPTSAYSSLQLDVDAFDRIDSGSSFMTFDMSASVVNPFMLVDSAHDDLWVTNTDFPAELPLEIMLYPGAGDAISSGGESMITDTIVSTVSDTFTRAAADWGSTDTGELWVVGAGTPALFTTTGTVGRIAVTAINTEHFTTVEAGYAAHQTIRTSLLLNVMPSGAAINWGGILRYSDPNNLYWLDVQVSTTGTITLRVLKKKAGFSSLLFTAISLVAHSVSVARTLLAEITADNLIRLKVYPTGSAEPIAWELTYQDTSGDLLTGTRVGCIARLTLGNTNVAPINFDFDNFEVVNPQRFEIDQRATNNIMKAHKAGTVVRVRQPSIIE